MATLPAFFLIRQHVFRRVGRGWLCEGRECRAQIATIGNRALIELPTFSATVRGASESQALDNLRTWCGSIPECPGFSRGESGGS